MGSGKGRKCLAKEGAAAAGEQGRARVRVAEMDGGASKREPRKADNDGASPGRRRRKVAESVGRCLIEDGREWGEVMLFAPSIYFAGPSIFLGRPSAPALIPWQSSGTRSPGEQPVLPLLTV